MHSYSYRANFPSSTTWACERRPIRSMRRIIYRRNNIIIGHRKCHFRAFICRYIPCERREINSFWMEELRRTNRTLMHSEGGDGGGGTDFAINLSSFRPLGDIHSFYLKKHVWRMTSERQQSIDIINGNRREEEEEEGAPATHEFFCPIFYLIAGRGLGIPKSKTEQK